MFNGIIEYLGVIAYIHSIHSIVIALPITNVRNGDSISCNGVCLTVTEAIDNTCKFYLSEETLSCSNFKNVKVGDCINLEKALCFGDKINGHLVSGHIDIASKILYITPVGGSYVLSVELPQKYIKYIVTKGSIAINGVSLTVNNVYDSSFEVNIIPHTFLHTNFQYLSPGSIVNIEIDVFARYVEKMLHPYSK